MEQDLENNQQALNYHEVLSVFARRKVIVIQSFLVIASVTTVITMMTKPVYEATARLLVEPSSMNLNTVDTSNPLSQILALGQPQTVSTQVEMLQSHRLLSKIKDFPISSIVVTEVKDTNLIAVTAESNLADAAAAAPNRLLEAYIDEDVNQNLNEVRNAEAFAKQQGEDAHAKLIESERDLRIFKQQRHVAELDKNRDADISVATDSAAQLRTAKSNLAALRAQLAVARHLLTTEPATIPLTVQSTNAMRANLMSQIETLKVTRAAMSQKHGYTATSARRMALDSQIDELKSQLKAQPELTSTFSTTSNPTQASLREQVASLTTQESALVAQVAQAEKALASANERVSHFPLWEVTLADLTRQHDAAQAADKMFAEKLADLTLREQAQHATARIFDRAVKPAAPVRPKRVLNILLGCLLGLITGICLALLQEFLDDRINTADDAERLTQLPTLGYVPALTASDARLLPLMNSHNHAAESYRVLRTNIHFASVDKSIKSIVVTSSNPGEGKSTTAVNLAFAMALDGKRVILVDTDLRRPSLHRLLNLTAVPGLTDILLGHSTISECLRQTNDVPNLQIVSSGSTPPNPSELLNSQSFKAIASGLSELADVVIFDSPPVLVTADAAILASQVDGTVFVIETGATKKTAAKRAIGILRQAHAKILGVAYNKMRRRGNDDYYYYNYNYSSAAITSKNGNSPQAQLEEKTLTGSGKDAK